MTEILSIMMDAAFCANSKSVAMVLCRVTKSVMMETLCHVMAALPAVSLRSVGMA